MQKDALGDGQTMRLKSAIRYRLSVIRYPLSVIRYPLSVIRYPPAERYEMVRLSGIRRKMGCMPEREEVQRVQAAIGLRPGRPGFGPQSGLVQRGV